MKRILSLTAAVIVMLCGMSAGVSADTLSTAYIQSSKYADGWHTDSDGHYFYTQDNSRLKGWYTIDDASYYFGEDGLMYTGWLQQDGSYYYLRADGRRATDTTLTIDGKTYSFGKDGKYYVPKTTVKAEKKSTSSSRTSYVLNKNTKKFHLPSCSSVSEMSAKNKEDYIGSRDDLISKGYSPCKRCKP